MERARIALERLRLQQENTRKELQQLQLAEDKEKLQQQADALSAKIEKKLAESTDEIIRRDSKPIQPGKPLLRGSAAGTAEDPLYCDWNSGDALTEQNLSVLLPEGGEGTVCGAGDPPGRRDTGGHHRQLGPAPDPWRERSHLRVAGGASGGGGYLRGRHHRRDTSAAQGAAAGAGAVEPILYQGGAAADAER